MSIAWLREFWHNSKNLDPIKQPQEDTLKNSYEQKTELAMDCPLFLLPYRRNQ